MGPVGGFLLSPLKGCGLYGMAVTVITASLNDSWLVNGKLDGGFLLILASCGTNCDLMTGT